MEKELQKVENKNVIEYLDNNVDVKDMIYTIRGKQVILDSDIARLYHYETKKVNQAMKRNIQRFPENFCFQLNQEEVDSLKSQIVTLKNEIEVKNLRSQFVTSSLENDNYGGRRYLPYAYTEQGIAMLAGVLKSDIAV